MFIAMNRFKVKKGSEHDFEQVWLTRETHREGWTRSEAFRKAHAGAGANKPLYLGHPEFEGFTTLQGISAKGA